MELVDTKALARFSFVSPAKPDIKNKVKAGESQ
jgi:hypothetical protein